MCVLNLLSHASIGVFSSLFRIFIVSDPFGFVSIIFRFVLACVLPVISACGTISKILPLIPTFLLLIVYLFDYFIVSLLFHIYWTVRFEYTVLGSFRDHLYLSPSSTFRSESHFFDKLTLTSIFRTLAQFDPTVGSRCFRSRFTWLIVEHSYAIVLKPCGLSRRFTVELSTISSKSSHTLQFSPIPLPTTVVPLRNPFEKTSE